MAKDVKVKPHPEAGTTVVGPDGEVYREGSTATRSTLDYFGKKENYGRPTQAYPEGYPLLVEIKVGE